MSSILAYHGDPALKDRLLAEIAAHREADALVQGHYWQDGKGCAVGCLTHDPEGGHEALAERTGIPLMLLHLEDRLFEGLPMADAKLWPERFLASIVPGADLSRVGWQFLHWLLTEKAVNPGIEHPLVRDAVRLCADTIEPRGRGEPVSASAAESAESAASAAASAAWSAARSAESAAWSAVSAAWSARSAAWSAESAVRSAAWSAASAAWSAASAAWRAGSARSAAYRVMADKLVELLEAAR